MALKSTAQDILMGLATGDLSAITELKVSGFASCSAPQSVDIRPLTVLAGANSTGKSSAIKPLLMLKQTLDDNTDSGPLSISGDNVQFASFDEIFTHVSEDIHKDTFSVTLEMARGKLELDFSRKTDSDLVISKAIYELSHNDFENRLMLTPSMSSNDIESQISDNIKDEASRNAYPFQVSANYDYNISELIKTIDDKLDVSAETIAGLRSRAGSDLRGAHWEVKRQRCFLVASFTSFGRDHYVINPSSLPTCNFASAIKNTLHIPAFRRRNIRNHRRSDVRGRFAVTSFPGTFEDYTASVVSAWEADGDERLARLIESLKDLGLTSKVSTNRISDIEIELRIARPGRRDSTDRPEMISLADVGIGVSYVLPVLVALEAAAPGQIVYVEQPESHLHPRAEYGLAKALARAASRGVRVIAETHSSLLLLHIQTLVARGELEPSKVGLHWFSLDEDGFTKIEFVQPDEHGRTGDWPEDFADTEMHASSQFIRAARGR